MSSIPFNTLQNSNNPIKIPTSLIVGPKFPTTLYSNHNFRNTQRVAEVALKFCCHPKSKAVVVKRVMPVPREVTEIPFLENSKQIGINKSLLYNGSTFKGFQKSKGNSYEVEVVLQVR
jgi:hypothetical protein